MIFQLNKYLFELCLVELLNFKQMRINKLVNILISKKSNDLFKILKSQWQNIELKGYLKSVEGSTISPTAKVGPWLTLAAKFSSL